MRATRELDHAAPLADDRPPLRPCCSSPRPPGRRSRVSRADCEAAYPASWGRAGKDVVWVPTSDAVVLAMLTMARGDAAGPACSTWAPATAGSPSPRRSRPSARGPSASSTTPTWRSSPRAWSRRRAWPTGSGSSRATSSRRTSATRASSPCTSCPSSTSACGTASWPWSPARASSRTSSRWRTGSPTQSVQIQGRDVYLWVVPARVDGVWDFQDREGTTFAIDLRQTFGKLSGEITRGGVREALLSATVHGLRAALHVRRGRRDRRVLGHGPRPRDQRACCARATPRGTDGRPAPRRAPGRALGRDAAGLQPLLRPVAQRPPVSRPPLRPRGPPRDARMPACRSSHGKRPEMTLSRRRSLRPRGPGRRTPARPRPHHHGGDRRLRRADRDAQARSQRRLSAAVVHRPRLPAEGVRADRARPPRGGPRPDDARRPRRPARAPLARVLGALAVAADVRLTRVPGCGHAGIASIFSIAGLPVSATAVLVGLSWTCSW